MRPSVRLIALAGAAFALSILTIPLGAAVGALAQAAWIALLLAVVVDIAVSPTRAIAITAEAPREIFTGETGLMRLVPSRSVPGLAVRVDWPAGLDGPHDAATSTADAAFIEVPVAATRRGAFTIERAWLAWPSRLRLIEFVRATAIDVTIKVVPNIRPVLSGTIDVKVRSTLFGVKEVFAVGEGSEFHQLREFAQGMDIRTIDWKQSARHRQLLAKETRAERNHHVIVALDNGYLMGEEVDGLPKIDHAVNAALATAWAAGLGGDLVGLFVYDAMPRLFVPPEPGRAAFARLRSHTADLTYVARETNHTLAMSSLMARTPRRSLIIIFTDFVDPTTAELLVDNVAVLIRRHVVVMVALGDPALSRMVSEAPDSIDDVARSVVVAELLRERAFVLERLAALGITVIDVEPKALTARLVSAYLDLKAREVL